MGTLRRLWSTFYLVSIIYAANGCDIAGVTNTWLDLSVTDTDTGIFFQGATQDFGVITSATHAGDVLNFGPYFEVSHANNQFILSLHENFALYERYETLQSFSVSVSFTCTNGNAARTIIFIVSVVDTNNNDPIFTPTEDFSYTVTPPLSPGYEITGCVSDINVEDIDLTTQRIDFNVENGDGLFEIVYDPLSSTAKNFRGILRTTGFVRSIPEPLTLTVSATDVDLTGDPQRTTYTTITIQSDGEFEYPDELVFSKPFYLATYSDDHVLSVEPISLIQGYAEDVVFNLTGDYSEYFNVTNINNVITLASVTSLPEEVLLNERQFYLVVNAAKELTSGATATIIVQLPEAETLQFEQQLYEGTIVDNILTAPTLVLSQGYENGFTVSIGGVYSTNFTYTTQENTITLTITSLEEEIIQSNNVITLQVTAETASSSATAVVSLSIVKNDTLTPIFARNIYSGSYNPDSGLTLEDVVLSQGYDETVSFYLEGEHENLFTFSENENVVTLELVSDVPQAVIEAGRDILLTLSAFKDRTVGANTAISITLPQSRELGFEQSSYTGQLQNGIFNLEIITLDVGYMDDVTFEVTGDYSTYFTATNDGSDVTVALTASLPESVISEYNLLVLILEADSSNAIKATTSIVVEIIKDDTLTPVFSQNMYEGTYSGAEADLGIGTISLSQGYDETVSFRIVGDHAQYFTVNTSGNSIVLFLPSLPDDVVFSEKKLIFNVVADKPLTVGGLASVAVSFPQEYTEPAVLGFSRSAFVGTLNASSQVLELENLVLENGYAVGTGFLIDGEYASHFSFVSDDNNLELFISEPLPVEVLQNNKFLVLQVTAQRERAVTSTTTVIIDILAEDNQVDPPVFSQTFYTGIYKIEEGLQFNDFMSLTEGFDDTVTFVLDDEVAEWFVIQQNGNNLTLEMVNSIPEETVFSNRQLLFSIAAYKGTLVDRAAISIDLIDESPSLSIGFASNTHVGRIENMTLALDAITLLGDYEGAIFRISDDYENNFNIIQNGDSITLELTNQLPDGVMLVQPFVVFEIEATRGTAAATTTVLLEIVRETDPVLTPVFGQAYYSGNYSAEQGFLFEETISLIQGYSDDLQFSLEGDDAQWFVFIQNGNGLTLSVGETGLPPTASSNLLFSVLATKTGALTGSAAIVIHLADSDIINIQFASSSNVGRIENGVLHSDPITLMGDYEDATFSISDGYGDYFNINQNGNTITLDLTNQLPDEVMLVQPFVVFDIEASTGTATATTTVVLEIVRESDSVPTPVFSQAYYSGNFSANQGLLIEQTIFLIQGYSDEVQFTLDGDDSQGFVFTQNGNSISLAVAELGIPASNNGHLLFSVLATRTGTLTGSAAIVIHLADVEIVTIQFTSSSNVGRMENGLLQIDPITLIGDYEDVTFSISDGYGDYFNINQNDDSITLELTNQLPDEVVLVQPFVVFEIEATTGTATATTTVVLEIVRETDPVPTPVFSQAYYSGNFSANQGLLIEQTISLIQGYSDEVQFTLDGDDSQGFVFTQNGNSISLAVAESGIPASNNGHLLFSVLATRTGALTGSAAIVIHLADSEILTIGFGSSSNVGRIENGVLYSDPITLIGNYEDVTFSISDGYGDYFNVNQNGNTFTLELTNQLPEEVMLVQPFVVFEIEATTGTAAATTTVVLEIMRETDPVLTPVFGQAYYSGNYTAEQGFLFEETISLIQGYSDDVQFSLEGDDAQWFAFIQNGNGLTLSVGELGLPATASSNLLFSVLATKTGALTGSAAIVIHLADADIINIQFASSSNVGRIENGVLYSDPITLIGDYEDATFSISDGYGDYFNINKNGNTITLDLTNQLPDEVMLVQPFVVFEIEATTGTATATTTVVLEIVRETDPVPTPVFSQAYYSGSFSAYQGLLFEETISLIQGFSDDVQFTLAGDDSQWFVFTQNGNSLTLSVGETGLPATDGNSLLFSVLATRTGALTGSAAIVIHLADSEIVTIGFGSSSNVGRIENGVLYSDPITLIGNYEDVTFSISDGYGDYFNVNQNGNTFTLELTNQLPDEVMLLQLFVVFEIEATTGTAAATTTIVLEIVRESDPVPTPVFDQAFYSGIYSANQGLLFEENISLIQGYSDDVQFNLEGDDAQGFDLSQSGNSLTVVIGETGIPSSENDHLMFSVVATRTGALSGSAAIVITFVGETTDVLFERALYRGIFSETLQHEPITIIGYNGTEVELSGDYEELFEAQASSGVVIVQTVGAPSFASDVLYVGLEMSAGGAHTALVIQIDHSEQPTPPTVSFESSSYEISTDVSQSGLVGRVQATASNGEAIVYSLVIDNAHLQERLSINSAGELQLFATTDSGIYNFAVTATASASQVFATATVRMTVEAIVVCGDDNYVVPPLIIINRDEEESHSGLVVLNLLELPGCQYEMTNRWPLDQNWLYVNESGLHTTAIDREHESIAFMALSQVQVELLLVCDTDDASRSIRSKRDARPDWLGPYDYSNSEWVLTETILHNSRRSLVNLIVNDINDNAPVFDGKENEPLAVGYPEQDLLQVVTPRALIQLKAMDIDIGINADLVYWSSADPLAVGPKTGTIHVRDNYRDIAEGTVMTVHATDRAGEGLTGDVDIVIRLLDSSHIAVLKIRDAFEEDEEEILESLTNAVGYEIRALSSNVISDSYDDVEYNLRQKRQVVESRGASLQLFVYGLYQRNPIDVDQLTSDINNNVIVSLAVADTVSLQDYLANLEICEVAGRDIGLFVATIVLSVILFILIVLIGLWFFLRWRKGRNYEEFSDINSIASRNNSTDGSIKAEPITRPAGMNIAEIQRSQKRLREMLDAPIQEEVVPPSILPETKVEVPLSTAPIVIQSIDKLKDANDDSDEDEFGERQSQARKKSVVTFNENVEKIIHMEDNPEDNDDDIEIYKL